MSRLRLRPASLTATVVCALTIGAMPPLAARQSDPVKKGAETADAPRRQGFSIVLLVGDMKGGESVEGVPVAARKALADTKDFLPYKNYRLLDSQWTLCCVGGSSAITRLRGVDDQEYELELRANPILLQGVRAEPGALSVRFLLRELNDAPIPAKSPVDRSRAPVGKSAPPSHGDPQERAARIGEQLFDLEREAFDLKSEQASLSGKVDIGLADPTKLKRVEGQLTLVRQRIAALKNELNYLTVPKPAPGSKAIIDTSFRMEVGETVVVGTSGLKGGSRALIALLTAVGSSKPR